METKERRKELHELCEALKQIMPRHPREAAKYFALPYIITHSWYELLTEKIPKKALKDYSARLEKKKIIVSKFYDVPVHEVYDTEDILADFTRDLIQLYSNKKMNDI